LTLIIGGAHQGKLAYALECFQLTNDHVHYCGNEDVTTPQDKAIIYEIDRWILALVQADMNVSAEIEKFAESNKNAIVICNDISCGVVPVDAVMRKWREETGRAMGILAQHSDEVVRLFCGIPARLK